MSSSGISRHLVALDIISQDLDDERVTLNDQVSEEYIRLLQQYLINLQKLERSTTDLTEVGFSQATGNNVLRAQLRTKRLIGIHKKLLEFVIEFFTVNRKASVILDSEFGSHADERLGLLQTRGIKARNQFKTVAQALGKDDYLLFFNSIALPTSDWAWESID